MELGYHLCYGDRAHQHFKEPEDTSLVVRPVNGVATRLTRPLTWIHLPVPLTRDDDSYFAPLDELQLRPETEIYLGLVHYHDGIPGAERRIEAARRHLASFGVATEYGLGHRPAETIAELLRIHAAFAAPSIRPAPDSSSQSAAPCKWPQRNRCRTPLCGSSAALRPCLVTPISVRDGELISSGAQECGRPVRVTWHLLYAYFGECARLFRQCGIDCEDMGEVLTRPGLTQELTGFVPCQRSVGQVGWRLRRQPDDGS